MHNFTFTLIHPFLSRLYIRVAIECYAITLQTIYKMYELYLSSSAARVATAAVVAAAAETSAAAAVASMRLYMLFKRP